MVVFQQLQHDFGYCLGVFVIKKFEEIIKGWVATYFLVAHTHTQLHHRTHVCVLKFATCYKVLFARTSKRATARRTCANVRLHIVRVRTQGRNSFFGKLWIAALLANTFVHSWLDVYSFDVIGTNCGLLLARITKLFLRHNPIDFCLTNVSRVWEKKMGREWC